MFTIQEKKLSVRDKIEIERDGKTVATVKKALVGIRDRYSIEVEGGDDLSAKGNIVDHEYEIERDGDKVAEVSKKWFRVRDTYGIEVDSRSGRRADPGRHGLHRPDEPRLRRSGDGRHAVLTTATGRSIGRERSASEREVLQPRLSRARGS